jgi:hypothetical protein
MSGLPGDRLNKEPREQRSMKLSCVLSDRLDELVQLVNRDCNLPSRVYRHDLLAVLIARAPESVAEWTTLYDDYMEMKNRDAQVGDAKNANVIELRAVKPGRRSTSA